MTSVEDIFDQAFPPPEPAISPFIDGDGVQYAWDSTSLEYLKRCPRLYQYQREGWQPNDENVHLRFGSEFHTAMHQYELLKADDIEHEEAVFLVIKDLLLRIDDFRPDHKYKNRLNLVRAVVRYLDKFQDDKAKTVILDNGKPAVGLSFRFELDYGPTPEQPYILCGHLDRVVDFQGDRSPRIINLVRVLLAPTSGQFEPTIRCPYILWLAKIIFQTNIKGVLIDSIQLMVDDTRMHSRDYLSDRRPDL